ncbi:MAG: tRNA 2-thiocytidine biosynthesis protein TtcA [Bacilli bacterium]|nr:tRNA 2-thiocytidine biosynthesis protein TtcA [Bacilli bacterium]
MNKKKVFTQSQMIERSLDLEFKFKLWRPFTAALQQYKLVNEGDKVCVCISGGKDSMAMALLFKHLKKYSPVHFDVKYLVMNPGYNERNLEQIKTNLKKLEIPATIVSTDIFEIANNTEKSPCYLCAKMRRGALYRIAKEYGCNKIALGHHYDDVIGTTLMNMLNSGSFQTMLPKLHSTHYSGMEIIRPLYFIREEHIIEWKDFNGLEFIACACKFTENVANSHENSQRLKTKHLIAELKENYNPYVEKNLFRAAENVTLDMILGYNYEGVEHSFMDTYEEDCKRINQAILDNRIEEKALLKADSEHRAFVYDDSLNFEKENVDGECDK